MGELCRRRRLREFFFPCGFEGTGMMEILNDGMS